MALIYDDYPWYFEVNDVMEAWSVSQGRGVVVDVADSCVDFSMSPLSGKNFGTNEHCANDSDDLYKIHGTAMAGLIAAKHSTLPQRDNPGSLIDIAGIAPESLIKNIISTKLDEVSKGFEESQKERLKDSYGKPVLKGKIGKQRPEMILINVSGGQSSSDTEVRGGWSDLIKKACKDEKTLIVAAVGNKRTELTQENIVKNGVLPAGLTVKRCADKDPVIRVGATNKYSINETPDLYKGFLGNTGSNYGKKYVDILAPGQEIPILTPGNKATIGSGTSESAAIVTGTLALLVSCKPYATAYEIKKALLDSSNRYQELEQYALNGTVLNIEKVVKDFCFNQKKKENNAYIDETSSNYFVPVLAALAVIAASYYCLKNR